MQQSGGEWQRPRGRQPQGAVSSFNVSPSVTHTFKCWQPMPSWTRISQIRSSVCRWFKPCLVFCYFLLHCWLRKSWIISLLLCPDWPLAFQFPIIKTLFLFPKHLMPVRSPNWSPDSVPYSQRTTYQAKHVIQLSQHCLRSLTATPMPSSVQKPAQKAQTMGRWDLGGNIISRVPKPWLGEEPSPSNLPAALFPAKKTTPSLCCFFVRA